MQHMMQLAPMDNSQHKPLLLHSLILLWGGGCVTSLRRAYTRIRVHLQSGLQSMILSCWQGSGMLLAHSLAATTSAGLVQTGLLHLRP